nr:transposase, mutator type [Tanacetum cinerariifolium]
MNNFSFTTDLKHDLSIGVVEVHEDDLDVIDYDSFGSDLDDEIDSEKRIQLTELRRIGKQKKGPNKYYFYLGQQFAYKERVTRRVRMHSFETRRKLIMVKNDKEMVRVRCEGTTVRIDVQQEPNSESLTRNFKRVYVCLGALKQGFRDCGREILGLDRCFMSGPWPGKRHIHENMKSQFKGGVYKEILWNAAKATSIGKFNKKMADLKSFNSDAYDWLKIPAEQQRSTYFSDLSQQAKRLVIFINNIMLSDLDILD